MTYPLTDTGNAERFAAMWGASVHFVAEWNTFVTYTGKYWKRDVGNLDVATWVKTANRSIAGEVIAVDEKEYRAAMSWAKTSDSMRARKATAEAARTEVRAVSPDRFDTHDMLLNLSNGTLDLETGKLRAHDRDELHTKMIEIDYDPAAECPTFERFLSDILPPEDVEFIGRAIGYSLTGRVDEHALFLAYGPGNSGKSTMINVGQDLLGPYACPAERDLLLSKKNESHPAGLAQLRGKRFVACQEIDEGRHWAEASLKALTGGDRISARGMHENFYSFKPTHKFWIGANARPVVTSGGEALWRRIILVPFARAIPPEKREHDLGRRLHAELPGIMAWAVRGCARYLESGLKKSDSITVAVAAYKAEADPFGAFISERCTTGGRVTRADVYSAYVGWCDGRGDEPMVPKEFTPRVRALHGVQAAKVRPPGKKPVDGWSGLSLRQQRSDVATCSDLLPISSHEEETREFNREVVPTSHYVTTEDREPGSDDDMPAPPRFGREAV